jgi:hypothetical protein
LVELKTLAEGGERAAGSLSVWWMGGRVERGECVWGSERGGGDEGRSESKVEPLGMERGADEGGRCEDIEVLVMAMR